MLWSDKAGWKNVSVRFRPQEFGTKSSAAATAANDAPTGVAVELPDADISQYSAVFLPASAATYSNNGSQTMRLTWGDAPTDTKAVVRIYTKGTKISGWIPLADELTWTSSDGGFKDRQLPNRENVPG